MHIKRNEGCDGSDITSESETKKIIETVFTNDDQMGKVNGRHCYYKIS